MHHSCTAHHWYIQLTRHTTYMYMYNHHTHVIHKHHYIQYTFRKTSLSSRTGHFVKYWIPALNMEFQRPYRRRNITLLYYRWTRSNASRFPNFWRYSTVLCMQILVDARRFLTIVYIRCMSTLSLPAKDENLPNDLYEFDSVACATAGAFCENCSVPLSDTYSSGLCLTVVKTSTSLNIMTQILQHATVRHKHHRTPQSDTNTTERHSQTQRVLYVHDTSQMERLLDTTAMN